MLEPLKESPSSCKGCAPRCPSHKRSNGRAPTGTPPSGSNWFSTPGPNTSSCPRHELSLSWGPWSWESPAPNSMVTSGRSYSGPLVWKDNSGGSTCHGGAVVPRDYNLASFPLASLTTCAILRRHFHETRQSFSSLLSGQRTFISTLLLLI